jgi:hypothetical protein
MVWWNIGMGLLGALTGVLIGWSASPVVTTALPLIFGLVGGASVYQLSKAWPVDLLKLVGSSLAAFCLLCLVALTLAILVRGPLSQIGVPGQYELKSEQITNLNDGINKVMLRKRLESLGATGNEIKSLFERENAKPDFKVMADKIASASQSFVSAYEKQDASQQEELKTNLIELFNLYNLVKLFLVEKAVFESSAQDPTISEARFRYLTDKLYEFKGKNDSESESHGVSTPSDQPKPTSAAIATLSARPALAAALASLVDAILLSKESGNILHNDKINNMDELLRILPIARQQQTVLPAVVPFSVGPQRPFFGWYWW